MTMNDDLGMISKIEVNQRVSNEMLDKICDEMTDSLIQKIGELQLTDRENFNLLITIVEHLYVTTLMPAILTDMMNKKTSLSKAKEKVDKVVSSSSITIRQVIKKNLADAFMTIKNAQDSNGITFVIKK